MHGVVFILSIYRPIGDLMKKALLLICAIFSLDAAEDYNSGKIHPLEIAACGAGEMFLFASTESERKDYTEPSSSAMKTETENQKSHAKSPNDDQHQHKESPLKNTNSI